MRKETYVKAGDKIRCTNKDYPPARHKAIYTVKSASNDKFIIEEIEQYSWTNPLNNFNVFKLYEESPKSAPKFKIGGKVKVIGKIRDYKEIGWADSMKKYIGQVGNVLSDKVLKDNSVKVVFEDGEYWYLNADSLELVEDNPSMEQTLKKLQEDIIKVSGIPPAFFKIQSPDYRLHYLYGDGAKIFTNKKKGVLKNYEIKDIQIYSIDILQFHLCFMCLPFIGGEFHCDLSMWSIVFWFYLVA
jgi:hypothetical protein